MTSNRVIIASAGSGKTTSLVEEALSRPAKSIALVTYTIANCNEIKRKLHEQHGAIPSRVDVIRWFTFLLHECVRPYQRFMHPTRRIKGIHFVQNRSAKWVEKKKIRQYYFWNDEEIFSDKIAEFALGCDDASGGLVLARLSQLYDEVFIDELQDLSGYDMNLVERMLQTGIRMVMVGDPRQLTYTTSESPKNRQYRGVRIRNLISEWEKKGLCQAQTHAWSYRCNQLICDFADKLWPTMPNTESRNGDKTGHDGVFVVPKCYVDEYIGRFSPVVLRYSRTTKETYGKPALNFGYAKGLTCDRVLILPHGPIRKYLAGGDVDDVKASLERFYVAVTRARYSVAFAYDGECSVGCTPWKPGARDTM